MFAEQRTNSKGYLTTNPIDNLHLSFQFICCAWPKLSSFSFFLVSHKNRRKAAAHYKSRDKKLRSRSLELSTAPVQCFPSTLPNERRHVSTATNAIFSFFVLWSSSRLPLISAFFDCSFRVGGRFWWTDNFSRSHFQSHQPKRQRKQRGSLELQ